MPHREELSRRISTNLRTIADPHIPSGPKVAAIADILGYLFTYPLRRLQAHLGRRKDATKDEIPE